METSTPVARRLLAFFDHLGIAQAHVAARVAGDYTGLLRAYPERVTSVALLCPPGLDPAALGPTAARLLLVSGDRGPNARRAPESIAIVPGAMHVSLRDYFDADWSDVVADRADFIGTVLLEFLARQTEEQRIAPVALPAGEGEIAGLAYHIQGKGPPLLLLPLALAPSQWDPLVSALSTQYGTIQVGGPWLGYVATLEDRACSPGYLGLVQRIIEEVELQPGETVLDVGCGSGSLDRWLAARTAGANRILGTDVSPYLLREAAGLARSEGVDLVITFVKGMRRRSRSLMTPSM